MTDKPIPFSGPMIRALLDGRKTQTWRVLKPQFPDAVKSVGYTCFTPEGHISGRGSLAGAEWFRKLPFAPGDRLWVREAHYLTDDGESEFAVFAADEASVKEHFADMQATMASHPSIDWSKHLRLRPSIHMPRWASRLTLTVTDVRVQRLQEISERDAKSEGLFLHPNRDGSVSLSGTPKSQKYITPTSAFKDLWNSLHGPDAWDANQWVVALTFDVHRGNIDQMEAAE